MTIQLCIKETIVPKTPEGSEYPLDDENQPHENTLSKNAKMNALFLKTKKLSFRTAFGFGEYLWFKIFHSKKQSG